MTKETRGFATRAIHGSSEPIDGPVASPIVAASTYRFHSVEDLAKANDGRARADSFYSRYGNANFTSVEERVALLEGAEGALLFASGMAAISAVAFAFLKPGARLLAQHEIYGGTVAFFREVLAAWGVEVVFFDANDTARLEAECARGAALVYVETPTNPLCRIVDLRRVADAARKSGAPVVCDATFASPVNQATLSFGVDLVIQSATKYLGGHDDLLGGTVAGSRELLRRIVPIRKRLGGVPDPQQAWRLERSLKTVALRVARQNQSALEIARWLGTRQEVERVHYPGLPDHPDHGLARKQMKGFGGMLAFDLRGGEPAARRFAEALRLVALAPSLGSVQTLICPPIHTSHSSLSPEERRKLGILDGSLRLSVGIEEPADLIADLELGFEALARG
jgi:cystathionine beta-lyase/cystathionine gamma-synthase